jgi:hypothetical protein
MLESLYKEGKRLKIPPTMLAFPSILQKKEGLNGEN